MQSIKKYVLVDKREKIMTLDNRKTVVCKW